MTQIRKLGWCISLMIFSSSLLCMGDTTLFSKVDNPSSLEISSLMVDTLSPELLKIDTLPLKEKGEVSKHWYNKGMIGKLTRKGYPNPQKATFFSMILPGAGQAYNKHYWKLPLVAGMAYGGYSWITWSKEGLDEFQNAFDLKAAKSPEDPYPNVSLTEVDRVRTSWEKRYQQAWIGVVVGYLLVAADSYVSAHLKQFDVNENLSLQIKPAVTPVIGSLQPSLGMGISFRLK
jgi:hypothetical protein